jgi:hypothetical protein
MLLSVPTGIRPIHAVAYRWTGVARSEVRDTRVKPAKTSDCGEGARFLNWSEYLVPHRITTGYFRW